MNSPPGRRYCFADFELNANGTLRRGGTRIKIQPQPLRLLQVLVERPGQVILRDELRERIWGDATFVEFDQSLNYSIRQIRLALSDDASEPIYIETLPKQGYRFIAEVKTHSPDPPLPAVPPPVPDSPAHRRRRVLAASLAVLTILVAAGIWWRATRNDSLAITRVTRLTALPGAQTDPAFSPDGSSVAFSWAGDPGKGPHIYVLRPGGQTPIQLTHLAGNDMSPAWSPDGSRIAFLRLNTVSKGSLMVVPASGGTENALGEVEASEDVYRTLRPLLTWTPDGKGIVYTAHDPEFGRMHLFVRTLNGSATARRLFPSGESSIGNTSPAFSSDGKWLAYTEIYGPFQARMFVRPVDPGLRFTAEPTRIEGPDTLNGSPAWDSNGSRRRLLFTRGATVLSWEMGGHPREVYAGRGGPFAGMSVAWGNGHTPRVVAGDQMAKIIEKVHLQPGGLSASEAPVGFSAAAPGRQGNARFSPDGKWVVFVSGRTGNAEIWVTDANGLHPRQLTHLGASVMGYPRWSPDGKEIAFHAWLGNTPQVYTIEASGQALKRVTDSVFGAVSPAWSTDGKYLYVGRIAGVPRLFRVPAMGGPLEGLFEGSAGISTPDGRRILYFKVGVPGVFARSLDGDASTNPEERLVDDYKPPGSDVTPVEDGFYYVSWSGEGKPRVIRFYDYAQKKSSNVFVVPGPVSNPSDLTVSPDRRWLVYGRLTGMGTNLIQIDFTRSSKTLPF